ncbi:MAG: hypothetical protein HFE58_03460 [Firmicutes bacterium]|nr:hypothetical protein [Bacillota bacterium]
MKICNIDIDEIYEEVAKNSGFSIEEVKQMIQQTLNEAYENLTEEQKIFQDIILIKEKVPTFEEFVEFFIKTILVK